ncbi:hypothetical protein [Novosphingobium lindaniclasticum]|uniref:Uncharacterized protein n=1 Tax=Novosphingobium lindaniclasticum LE124 TaxID=1096930 RepID=T0HBM7_9SPHN|nr:hypothetical protein [Novosphingobium lindaniclasticum]EQB10402.1 hypothetical protein L284_17060 [Novosphingobium lindaniclasticum LE124]
MIARFRALALTTLIAITASLIALRDRLTEHLPVSIDRTVGGLDTIIAKLERAERQQRAIADAEVQVQEASYDREDAALVAAERAGRIRERVKALLA